MFEYDPGLHGVQASAEVAPTKRTICEFLAIPKFMRSIWNRHIISCPFLPGSGRGCMSSVLLASSLSFTRLSQNSLSITPFPHFIALSSLTISVEFEKDHLSVARLSVLFLVNLFDLMMPVSV